MKALPNVQALNRLQQKDVMVTIYACGVSSDGSNARLEYRLVHLSPQESFKPSYHYPVSWPPV